jgi:glutathione peroxidase
MRTRLAAAALGALALAALAPACGKRGDPSSDSTRSSTAMSFYSFSAAPLGSDTPVSLEKYQGKVLLVANTAAHCGYTPQYKPLGEVDRKYEGRGLRVLGFVSDDFGHQAGTTDEVKACSLDNKAAFDQFAEMHVKKGPDQHPLFAWLTSQPGQTGDVTWNFNKWLIGKSGEVLARWPSKVAPDAAEVTEAIEKALAAK